MLESIEAAQLFSEVWPGPQILSLIVTSSSLRRETLFSLPHCPFSRQVKRSSKQGAHREGWCVVIGRITNRGLESVGFLSPWLVDVKVEAGVGLLTRCICACVCVRPLNEDSD